MPVFREFGLQVADGDAGLHGDRQVLPVIVDDLRQPAGAECRRLGESIDLRTAADGHETLFASSRLGQQAGGLLIRSRGDLAG